jgi:hypothetical protein
MTDQLSIFDLLDGCQHGSHRRKRCPSLDVNRHPQEPHRCDCCGTDFDVRDGYLTRCRHCRG